jgi:hypothetical protein
MNGDTEMFPQDLGSSGWDAASGRLEADASKLAQCNQPDLALAVATPTLHGASSAFTPAECLALATARTRYQDHHDLFSERELAHLRFLRWLRQTNRLRA